MGSGASTKADATPIIQQEIDETSSKQDDFQVAYVLYLSFSLSLSLDTFKKRYIVADSNFNNV